MLACIPFHHSRAGKRDPAILPCLFQIGNRPHTLASGGRRWPLRELCLDWGYLVLGQAVARNNFVELVVVIEYDDAAVPVRDDPVRVVEVLPA